MIIPDDIRDAILTHTANCEPEECCGLLAFDGDGRVRFAYPMTNTDRSESSFTIDPAESYHVFLHAEKMGWAISGVFHSHPGGPDGLSARDLEEAPPGWIHLLATPNGLTAFRVSGRVATEITLAYLT